MRVKLFYIPPYLWVFAAQQAHRRTSQRRFGGFLFGEEGTAHSCRGHNLAGLPPGPALMAVGPHRTVLPRPAERSRVSDSHSSTTQF